MPTITPELREAIKKVDPLFTAANGLHPSRLKNILSFVAEREALARAEERERIRKEIKDRMVPGMKANAPGSYENIAYANILSIV